jgi:DNA-binding IclR family transcriptional regulator
MLLHLGKIYQSSLRLEDHVLPVIKRLVEETGEGASFFTRERKIRVCLFRVDSPKAIRDHVHAGDLLPLDRGAAGNVLLLFDPTLTPPDSMPDEPVIVTIGEREPDIAAVAAPVFGPGARLSGALAVSGPRGRFTKAKIQRISRVIIAAAFDLTSRLGGDTSRLQTRRQR